MSNAAHRIVSCHAERKPRPAHQDQPDRGGGGMVYPKPQNAEASADGRQLADVRDRNRHHRGRITSDKVITSTTSQRLSWRGGSSLQRARNRGPDKAHRAPDPFQEVRERVLPFFVGSPAVAHWNLRTRTRASAWTPSMTSHRSTRFSRAPLQKCAPRRSISRRLSSAELNRTVRSERQ